ncbi:MAG: tRNA uridine-5-carboxymethylaminomethyl(34) synthesis GTPase MnmE [Thermoanaerobaculia bacterium]
MNPSAFDTIVAPATATGRAALAIVRIDGADAGRIGQTLTRSDLPERRAVFGRLFDGDEEIDEAVAIRYAAPHSFTGNDLVEVTVHGSPLVVRRVIEAVIRLGARWAEPGEFSERAVLNGKIDLLQAEAIDDLISARTTLQARLSLSHLEGDLSRSANAIREELLQVISRLEAGLDFSEEGYEFIARDEVGSRLVITTETLERLLATFNRGRAATQGLHAVILGQPNAGKSTLLNYLCGSDRAIVTPEPGTTRDLIRETVEIGGLPVTLVDTAGLRSAADPVEQIGVSRAREAATHADLVLYLIDAKRGIDALDRDEIAARPDGLVVYTKCDLAAAPNGALAISITENRGLDALMSALDRTVRERFAPPESAPALVNDRQRNAVVETRDAIQSASESLRQGFQDEIVLVDLYRAANALGRLVGAVTTNDVYREIFSKFCIGK